MKTSPLLVGFSIPLARKSSNLLTREDSPQAITPTADRDQPVSRILPLITKCTDYNLIPFYIN
jgi:hypothetical protein